MTPRQKQRKKNKKKKKKKNKRRNYGFEPARPWWAVPLALRCVVLLLDFTPSAARCPVRCRLSLLGSVPLLLCVCDFGECVRMFNHFSIFDSMNEDDMEINSDILNLRALYDDDPEDKLRAKMGPLCAAALPRRSPLLLWVGLP